MTMQEQEKNKAELWRFLSEDPDVTRDMLTMLSRADHAESKRNTLTLIEKMKHASGGFSLSAHETEVIAQCVSDYYRICGILMTPLTKGGSQG